MKIIKKEYHIWAPRIQVWDALTNSESIKKWSDSPVKFEAKKEGKYSLWDGWVHGKILEIKPQEKLVMEWISDDDPKHKSKVTFKLTHKGGCTTLYMVHSNVSSQIYETTDKGWDEHYLGAIKDLLEN